MQAILAIIDPKTPESHLQFCKSLCQELPLDILFVDVKGEDEDFFPSIEAADFQEFYHQNLPEYSLIIRQEQDFLDEIEVLLKNNTFISHTLTIESDDKKAHSQSEQALELLHWLYIYHDFSVSYQNTPYHPEGLSLQEFCTLAKWHLSPSDTRIAADNSLRKGEKIALHCPHEKYPPTFSKFPFIFHQEKLEESEDISFYFILKNGQDSFSISPEKALFFKEKNLSLYLHMEQNINEGNLSYELKKLLKSSPYQKGQIKDIYFTETMLPSQDLLNFCDSHELEINQDLCFDKSTDLQDIVDLRKDTTFIAERNNDKLRLILIKDQYKGANQ